MEQPHENPQALEVAAPPQHPMPRTQPPSVEEILSAVVTKGVTQENVAAVSEVVKLYERLQEKDAERKFATAFVALQADMPNIEALKPVPARDGSVKYKYAPYEEIMDKVRPLLHRHGFTVTFSMRFADGRIIQTCTLQHTAGHKRSNDFAVRVGGGPPGATESQADGAAATYAKRGALCDALNIIIEKDTDARVEGGFITEAQAMDLKRRVRETGSDESAFLKFAGADTYEHIVSAKYAILDENLRRKEKTT